MNHQPRSELVRSLGRLYFGTNSDEETYEQMHKSGKFSDEEYLNRMKGKLDQQLKNEEITGSEYLEKLQSAKDYITRSNAQKKKFNKPAHNLKAQAKDK